MKPRSLTELTFRGFAWTLVGTGGQSVVHALAVVVLARLLAPEDFGVVGAALVVIGFTQIFTRLGVGPAIVQMVGLTAHHVHVGFAISIMLGATFALTVAAIAPLLATFFRMPDLEAVVRLLALTFPIAAVSTVGSALLQRAMAFRALAAIQFVSHALGYGAVGITFAALGAGVWSLAYAQLGQITLQALLVALARRDALGLAFSRPAAARLLRFGAGFSLARLANYAANQADNVVVGRGLGADALGAYGRAYQFMMLPANLIGTVLDKVLFPAMASIQSDAERLSKAYLRALGGVALVTMPAAAVLGITAPELVQVVLGPQWSAVVAPFQVLVAFLVFRTGYKVSDALARATGAVYRRAWRQWVYAAAVTLGAWWGLVLGDTTGVAIGVGAAVALNFTLMLHLSITLTNVRWSQVASLLGRHLLIAVVVAIWAWGARALALALALPQLGVLAVAAATSILAWSALWWRLPGWFGHERHDLNGLIDRALRRVR